MIQKCCPFGTITDWWRKLIEWLRKKRLSFRDVDPIDFVNCDSFKSNTSYLGSKISNLQKSVVASYQLFAGRDFAAHGSLIKAWKRFAVGKFPPVAMWARKMNLKLRFPSTASAFSWEFIVFETFFFVFLCTRLCIYRKIPFWLTFRQLEAETERQKATVSCVCCLIIIVLYGKRKGNAVPRLSLLC